MTKPIILVVSICCIDFWSGFEVVESVVVVFEGVTIGLHCGSGLFAIADQVKYIMYRVIRPDCNNPDLGILSTNEKLCVN